MFLVRQQEKRENSQIKSIYYILIYILIVFHYNIDIKLITMFGYLRDFYQRHKKRILVTGAVAAGTYAISKYIQWKYEEWEEERIKEFTKLAKKKYHFESNQKTCTITFFSFLVDIRNTIAERLDTDSLLDILKLKPANKLEIWEQLKILSVCRVICSVVCNVILLILLKVQLNVVGGYIYVKSLNEDIAIDKFDMKESQEYQEYMNNVRYFVEKIVPNMIDDTVSIVQSEYHYLLFSLLFLFCEYIFINNS